MVRTQPGASIDAMSIAATVFVAAIFVIVFLAARHHIRRPPSPTE